MIVFVSETRKGHDMATSEKSLMALGTSQVEAGAALLARVFQYDPMMQYLMAESPNMLEKPARFYQAAIRMGLLYGEVLVTPSLDGIAVWVSPGNTDYSFGQLRRAGFITAMIALGLKPMGRFMKSANYVEKLTEQAISAPHWELMFIGVDPSQQRQGIGGTLLEPMLARADADGVPVYLDSANERNLSFYKRHGFDVAAHGQIPNGGPKIWGMLRSPRKKRKLL